VNFQAVIDVVDLIALVIGHGEDIAVRLAILAEPCGELALNDTLIGAPARIDWVVVFAALELQLDKQSVLVGMLFCHLGSRGYEE
jgi:hypothetical protein